MTKALELAKFGRESPPAGVVVGDSDAQTLSSKTFSDGPVFSGLNANGVPFLNASKVLSSSSTFVFDGTNLGVGVASPAYRFDVQGSGTGIGVARFASNDTSTTTALAIFQRSGGAVSAAIKYNATNSPLTIDFGTTTSHALTFITADTERLRITSGGNVGVGTDNPQGLLQVGITGNALIYANSVLTEFAPPTSGNDLYIFRSQNDGSMNFSARPGGGSVYRFWRGATQSMIINGSGQVGIGTDPTAKLHIKGTEYAQYIETASTTNGDAIRLSLIAPGAQSQVELDWWNDSTKTGGGYGLIQTGKTLNSPNFNFMVAKVGIGTLDPQDKLHVAGAIRSLSGTTGTLYLGSSTGGTLYPAAALVGTPSTLYAPIGRLSFQLPTHGANTDYGLTEQMSIEGTGADSRGAYKMVLLPHGGNVGIGKTNPQVALDVVGNAQVTTTAAGTYGLIAVGSSGGARDIFLAGQSGFSNGFTVRYDGAAMVYAFQDGNVCIGATTPFGNLGVAGSTNLGNNVASSQAAQYFTRLSGYAARYDASNRYGSYGQLIFHADDGWTGGARRWMITNVLNVTSFGIIRSATALTDPGLGDGGSVNSGTVDFAISNTGRISMGATGVSNNQAKLEITGGSLVVNSKGGGNRFQELQMVSGHVQAGGSTVWTTFMYSGPTFVGNIRVIAVDNRGQSFGCASWVGVANICYGGGSGPLVTQTAALSGSISAVNVIYNNSGYILQAAVTYSGATSGVTIYFSFDGNGSDAMYAEA